MTYTYHLNYLCIPDGGTPSELDCCVELPVKLQNANDIEQLKAALARDFIKSEAYHSRYLRNPTAHIAVIIRNIMLLTELSIIYSVPATSSDLEKQSSATPDCIKHSIASARRSELIEQLASCRKANGGVNDA